MNTSSSLAMVRRDGPDRMVLASPRGCTLPIAVMLLGLAVVLLVTGIFLDASQGSHISLILMGGFATMPGLIGAGLMLSPRRVILDSARREVIEEQRVFGLPQRTRHLYDALTRLTVQQRGEKHFLITAEGQRPVVLAEREGYAEARAVAQAASDALDLPLIDVVTDALRRKTAPKALALAGAPHPGPLPDGCPWGARYDRGTLTLEIGTQTLTLEHTGLRMGEAHIAPAALTGLVLRDDDVLVTRRHDESVVLAAGTAHAHRTWLVAAVRFYLGGGSEPAGGVAQRPPR